MKYKNITKATLAIRDKFGMIKIVGPGKIINLNKVPNMNHFDEIVENELLVDTTDKKISDKNKKGDKHN